MTGIIFDIKEFTVHDGPGPRMTIFLKGCPLRCRWCHNPEGLYVRSQILTNHLLCKNCGACNKPCTHEACQTHNRCVYACVSNAIRIVGEEVQSEKLAEKILKNIDMFSSLGGGVTLSGGEPLMQSDFVLDLVSKLPNIHKAIQTSGFSDNYTYQKVVSKFDYIMQDIKIADEKIHKEYTGVSNKPIIENIKWLKESGLNYIFRLPLIPNITDTKENLIAISNIVGDSPIELMPYNPYAGAKYASVGMEYTLKDNINNEMSNDCLTKYFSKATILR